MKIKLLFLSSLFTLMCLITTAQPPNDTFAGAIPITVPSQGAASPQFTLPFTTDGTTDSGQDNVGCSSSGNDQFFTWTATELTLTFTSLSPGNPGIAVYDTAGNQISCANTFVTNNVQSGWAIGDDLVIQIYDFAGSNADVAFDLFVIPCPAPSGLSETVTTTTADIAWTNNSTSTETILEYGLAGFTAGSGTVVNVSGGAVTSMISGLSPNTDYDYILTQDCNAAGNGTSVAATGSFTTAATCPAPTAFAASNITDVSLDLSWTNNTGASVVSSIEYGPDGFTLGTGTVVAAGADSASISGLTPETDYDFYVTQDCSATGDGLSDVTGPLSVQTACAVIVPDALETFDTFVPNCWEEASTGDLTTGPMTFGSGDWGVEEFAHASTSGGGAVNVNLWNLGTSDWLLSPVYDLSAGGYELNVDIAVTAYNSTAASAMGSDDQVILLYTEDGTTWNVLETWDVSNTPSNTGDLYNNPLTGLTGATTQFAFYATEGAVDDPEDIDFHLDNFQVRTPPTCPDTANLALVNSTDVEATINFDSGNATSAGNYEYSLTTVAGTAPSVTGAWTDVAGANPNVTYTITGLTAETEYFVHVREVCAVGDESAWSLVPLNFTTACAPLASPYFEDLEAFTPSTSFTFENCWDEISAGGFTWDLDGSGGTSSGGTGPSGANSGTNFFFTEATGSAFGDTAVLQSPAIDLSALTAPALIFQSHLNGASIGVLDVLVSANGGSFTSVYTLTGPQQTADTDPWSENIVDLAAYAGQTVVVRFSHTTADNGNGGLAFQADAAIDDISFTELPICNDVSAVMVGSVTSDSVTVSWTENSIPPATSWEVVAVPAGDPAPAVGTPNATANPYTLMGLSPETTYDIYVRADCSTGFVGPISATTDCAVIVPDALETFDTFVPNCWEEASTGDLTTGPMTFGSGDWGVEEFAHASTSGGGAVNVNLWNLGTSDWLLSPVYDLSAGGYELNADIAVTAYNSTAASAMGSDDQVILLYTEDGTTWNVLETWDVSNTPSNTGDLYNNPLTGLTGATTQFAFYATEGAVDDPEDIDFHLDNFQVRTPPTCPDTANLALVNSTDVEATINFDSGNATSAGNYEYSLTTVAGTAPAVSGAWTDVAGANPNVTYTITGLSPQTEYFVHVREVCAVGDESPWSTTALNFITDCAAVTMFPAVTDFTTNVPNACWNEAGDGEIATGPTGIGASEWKDGRAYTNGIGTVVPSNVMNLYRLGDREWLISETYDLSSLTTKILTVEVAVTDYSFTGTSTAADVGTMGSDDTVDLLITTDNGLTWTSLETWNAANQPAVTGDRLFYDLAAYSGTVQFAFFASDGTVDDIEDFDFHVSTFVVDATAGSDSILLENEVSLYPNPVTGDSMTINLGAIPANNTSVLIYNTLGQEVMYRDFDNVSNNTLVLDNLSSLTTGVYLVKISNGSSTTVKRFIKK